MALMCLCPLSDECLATFPHVLVSSGYPPVPNPILESQELQSFSLFPTMSILALPIATLNPSLLQLRCKDTCDIISGFHMLRPRKVAR